MADLGDIGDVGINDVSMIREDNQPLLTGTDTATKEGDTPGQEITSPHSTKCPCLARRYVVAIFIALGLFFNQTMRMSFNITLVAMVNYTAQNEYNDTSDECHINTDNNSSSDKNSEGEFNWSPHLQSVLLGCFYYGYVATQLVGGYLSERVSAKLMMLVANLTGGVLYLLMPVMARWSVYALIVNRTLQGLFQGPIYPAMMTLLAKWSPPIEGSRINAITYVGTGLGVVFGGYVSGLLCDTDFLGGWPSADYLMGLQALIWCIFWWLIVYDSPAQDPNISEQERHYIERATGKLGTIQYTTPPWCSLLTSKAMWGAVVAYFANGVAVYLILTTIPQYMHQILRLDNSQNGLFTYIPGVIGCLLVIVVAPTADYMIKRNLCSRTNTRKIFTTIAELGPAVAFIGIAQIECNKEVVEVLLIMASASYQIAVGGIYMTPLDIAPMYAGTIMGMLNMVLNTGGFLAPVLVNVITQGKPSLQRWRIVFYVVSGLSFVAAIVFCVLGSGEEELWAKKKRQLSEEEEDVDEHNVNTLADKEYGSNNVA